MRLDWWVCSSIKHGEPVTDEAMAFMNGRKKIFLVENQEEYALADALQYIYGAEVTILTKPKCSVGEVHEYLRSFDLVYTSWDPFDRNRI